MNKPSERDIEKAYLVIGDDFISERELAIALAQALAAERSSLPESEIEANLQAIEESIYENDKLNNVQHSVAYHDIQTAVMLIRVCLRKWKAGEG